MLHVAHVIELANLVVYMNHQAIVSSPVGKEVKQVVLTHHAVVVGHGVADGFRPTRIPVQALRHIGNTLFVGYVERRDTLPVLVGKTVRPRRIGHKAVPAGVKAHHIGNGQRTLDHFVQLVSDIDIFKITSVRAPHDFIGVDLVDRRDLVLVVVGRFDFAVLALLGGFLAFGENSEHAIHGHNLSALVHLHVAANIDDRATREF